MNCNNHEKTKKVIEDADNHFPKYIYCFGATGPRGMQGPLGVSDNIIIGNTITGGPTEEAAVIDTTGSPNHVLDFIIPRGIDGSIGPQGLPGPTGPQGLQGESGIAFSPKYGNFSNSTSQSMQFSISEVGFFKFDTAENVKGIQLSDNATLTIDEPGIYQIIIQFQITDNYNVRYVGLYINDVLSYTLNRSVVNGNYTFARIIRLEANDKLKIGAELLRIGVAANFMLVINKIDETV